MNKNEEIIEAMKKIDNSADKLFYLIRHDLERDLIAEARSHQNFVEKLLANKGKEKRRVGE